MKKILLGCLLLITACQTATPTPAPSLFPTTTLPPTPIPDTQTPEPTPTLEPTPTPLPRYFTHQFDSSLAGWVILQAGNDSFPISPRENSVFALKWIHNISCTSSGADYGRMFTRIQFTSASAPPPGLPLHEENGWFEYNVSVAHITCFGGKWLSVGIADYLPMLTVHRRIGQRRSATYWFNLNDKIGLPSTTILSRGCFAP
jgi:hypothetical protein